MTSSDIIVTGRRRSCRDQSLAVRDRWRVWPWADSVTGSWLPSSMPASVILTGTRPARDTTLRKAFTAIDDNWLALFGRVRERLTKKFRSCYKEEYCYRFSERAVPTLATCRAPGFGSGKH